MRGCLFIVAVCALLSLVLGSVNLPSSRARTGVALRGGAKGAKRKGKVSTSKARRSRASYSDDDDTDDSDDDYVPRGKKGKSSRQLIVRGKGKKGKRGAKESQLMKWAKTGYGLGSEATAGLKEKLSSQFADISKSGTAMYKDVHRKAKTMRSSAFEAMLLKATWPDDEPVPSEVLNEIIKHSIPAFKYGKSSADDDPYHMTLHKLWTKMCEKDWRIVTKSVFILHCISRDCQTDSCLRFAAAIKAMSKVRNPKNPTHKYFDGRMVSGELDEESKVFRKFVASYWAYVLHRSKTFSAKFAELKDLGAKTPEKKAVQVLKKAEAAIVKALECRMEEGLSKAKMRQKCNYITGHACRSVCADLRDLWKQFVPKVEMLATGGFDQDKGEAEKEEVLSLLQFTKGLRGQVDAYLEWAQASFQARRIKISVELDDKVAGIGGIDSLIEQFGGDADSPATTDSAERAGGDSVESVTDLSGGHVAKGRKDEESDEDESEEDEESDEDESEEDEESDEDEDDEYSDEDESEGDSEEEGDDEDEDDDEYSDDEGDEEESDNGDDDDDSDGGDDSDDDYDDEDDNDDDEDESDE